MEPYRLSDSQEASLVAYNAELSVKIDNMVASSTASQALYDKSWRKKCSVDKSGLPVNRFCEKESKNMTSESKK